MKNLSFTAILLSIFLLSACRQQPRQQAGPFEGVECFANQLRVFLCYDNKIEGFEVNVMLLPQLKNSGSTCQAIIDLAKDSCHLQFMHNAFVDTVGYAKMPKDTVIHLHYEAPKIEADVVKLEAFETLPFFFLDVDFCGEKELVVNLHQQGQYWVNAFQPFNIGYDYLYDNLKGKPFTKLDVYSVIDYRTRTIKLTTYSGANNWTCDIYKYKPKTSEYDFVTLLEHYLEEHDKWNEGNGPKVRRIVCRKDTMEWNREK